MGKKRRLIKKSNKFTTKHSSHPILKYINGKTQPIEKDVTEIIEEKQLPKKQHPKLKLKAKQRKESKKLNQQQTKLFRPSPTIYSEETYKWRNPH